MLRRSFPGATDVHVQLYEPVIAAGSEDDWKVTSPGRLSLIQTWPAMPAPVLLNQTLYVNRSPPTTLATVALCSNVKCGWRTRALASAMSSTPFDSAAVTRIEYVPSASGGAYVNRKSFQADGLPGSVATSAMDV